jgi:hypothetical protein
MSLLLQLDKALGASQVLVSGALANLTLSKRSAILDKSVNETLKGSLMNSPLTDKIFGLSLQKVQEEVSKAPQSVSVNVRLNEAPLEPDFWARGVLEELAYCLRRTTFLLFAEKVGVG